MGEFRVHHIRFFDYLPKAIHCMCYEKKSQKLALSRSDGSIEIWSVKDKWFQEKVIRGVESVEAVCWQNNRLFSAGLDGNVVEHDLLRLCPKIFVSSNAGPVWCLTTDSTNRYLAAGTEDGCVVLFDTDYNSLQYLKSFDRQEGRILCIAWHAADDVIVTGGVDSIRLWSVSSGHALQRLTLGRQENNKETIVWCLAVTSDMTIVSGDSRGKMSFWNGKHGTLIKSFQSHVGDILCLCVNDEENCVLSSGVDTATVRYDYLAPKAESDWKMWVRSTIIKHHTNDVRALAMIGDDFASGGVDTVLKANIYKESEHKYRQMKLHAIPHKSYVQVAKGGGLVMLHYPDYLEVWRLGHTNHKSDKNGEILPLRSNPIKLLQLKAKTNNGQIICSAISRDGKWLSYSDQESLKIYNLSMDSKEDITPKVSLKKVRVVSHVSPAHQMAFTEDEKFLITTTTTSDIQIIKVEDNEAVLQDTLPASSELPEHIHLLTVSTDGKLIATADNSCNVTIYSLTDKQLLFQLPRYSYQAVALSFTPSCKELVIAYADKKIYEFDVQLGEYTDWCKTNCSRFPAQWLNRHSMVRNIRFDPRDSNKILLQDESLFTILDKTKPFPETLYMGKHRHKSTDPSHTDHAFGLCFRYKFLLYLDTLEDDWLVVVEKPQTEIAESLPPPLAQKKFGI